MNDDTLFRALDALINAESSPFTLLNVASDRHFLDFFVDSRYVVNNVCHWIVVPASTTPGSEQQQIRAIFCLYSSEDSCVDTIFAAHRLSKHPFVVFRINPTSNMFQMYQTEWHHYTDDIKLHTYNIPSVDTFFALVGSWLRTECSTDSQYSFQSDPDGLQVKLKYTQALKFSQRF